MYRKIKSIILFSFTIFGVILMFACHKQEAGGPIYPPDTVNLVPNSSFEIDGSPSLSGWDLHTQGVGFISGVPPGSGYYSIFIMSSWPPDNYYIQTTVPAIPGTYSYLLSFFGKESGSLELFLKKTDTLILCQRLVTTDTVWTRYSVMDTISAEKGDSLTVRANAAPTEHPVTCYYDACELQIIY
jgi:hypothetical protein